MKRFPSILLTISVFSLLGIFSPADVSAAYNCSPCQYDHYLKDTPLVDYCIPDRIPNDNDHLFFDLGNYYYCEAEFDTYDTAGLFSTSCIKLDDNGQVSERVPATGVSGIAPFGEKYCDNPSAGPANTQCQDDCKCYKAGEKFEGGGARWCDPLGSGQQVSTPTAGNCNNGVRDEGETAESCPADFFSSVGEEDTKEVTVTQDLSPEEACRLSESGTEDYNNCLACIKGEGSVEYRNGTGSSYNRRHVWTELGCVDSNTQGTVLSILRIAVGIITGIAVFRLIQGGLLVSTGNPESVKEGQGIAIAAVLAIVFLGACVLMLQFAGIRILSLDGIGQYYGVPGT